MNNQTENNKILAITKDDKLISLIQQVLGLAFSNIDFAQDIFEAKRKVMENPRDIIIVDSDENDNIQGAIDLSETNATILLLVPQNFFDNISYQVEIHGIITVPKPIDAYNFYTVIKTACAVTYKIKSVMAKTIRLEEKMQELRLIAQAKMILMERQNFSESEAHRFIGKQAMDRCVTKIKIAKEIISD